MKTLYIIRHAKSSWSFDLNDQDRPLGVRGRRDAPKVGKYLSQNAPTPDLLITSPASRSLYTALFIADEWGYPEDEIVLTKELYHTATTEILELIKAQDDAHESIAIFGHNPGFTELINELSEEFLDNLPTGAVSTFSFDTDSWAEISSDIATQESFISPKRLKKSSQNE